MTPLLSRRQALIGTAAALAAFVLPAPRRRLNLMDYCGHGFGQYNLTLPWTVEDYTYATDAQICLRVRPESGDRTQREGKIPPVGDLTWNHDHLQGWQDLPKLEPILAARSWCPVCDGSGLAGKAIMQECEICQGTGNNWDGNGWNLSVPVPCKPCHGQGHVPPPGVALCPACKGKAIGIFPSVVCLEGHYFDAKLYEKARVLGGDYWRDNWHGMPDQPLLRFRFEGGLGQLMGLNTREVEHRIRETKR